MSQSPNRPEKSFENEEDYMFDEDDYDDYGDWILTQAGGGSKSKVEKRRVQRGGGTTTVYSSKHTRARVAKTKK